MNKIPTVGSYAYKKAEAELDSFLRHVNGTPDTDILAELRQMAS